jgi:hypothetical protein
MLTKAKDIKGYKLSGTDAEVGKVKEFYFDDKYWTIRYLVADTGNWLHDRKVLISPYFLSDVDHNSKVINVQLTKNQIENSPSLDNDKPVSRQFESEYFGYYGAPMYWSGMYMWGAYPYLTRDREKWRVPPKDENKWDPNLRSTKDVTGHYIQASDDEIGHVDDFIIDENNWAIRYLIVDTRNWLPGKKVLLIPQLIQDISWPESKVFVKVTRDVIKKAPEYFDDETLTRDFESRLHKYYHLKEYWIEEPVPHEYSR